MASLLLGSAGSALGGALLGDGVSFLGATLTGAQIGGALGAFAGSQIDAALTPGRSVSRTGPRLSDVNIQGSSEGAPIARLFGRVRVAGQLIWASRFKESAVTTRSQLSLSGSWNGYFGTATAGMHLLLQATWEPDIDRDGLGDETQDPNVGAAPGGGGGQAPGGGGTAADTTAPTVKLAIPSRKLRRAITKGLEVRVTCSEPCRATIRLAIASPMAARAGWIRLTDLCRNRSTAVLASAQMDAKAAPTASTISTSAG